MMMEQASLAGAYQTAFRRWFGPDAGFEGWACHGLSRASDQSLQLDSASMLTGTDPYRPGAYAGRNFYNGGAFCWGEALSQAMVADIAFTEAICSWHAHTPPGTWIEPLMRVQIDGRWSAWFSFGVWAEDASTVERHSVAHEEPGAAAMCVDTLTISQAVRVYQLKLRLFSTSVERTPLLYDVALACSTTPGSPQGLPQGNPARWNCVLAVPPCSQMTYPHEGNVWCSPVSLTMVMAYWQGQASVANQDVYAAARGVYDWCYDGYGNWAFSTAYCASFGLRSHVVRLPSLSVAEAWIAAGIPLVLAYRWCEGELEGAPIPRSPGHLGVLIGFDQAGNPVVNDPSAPSHDAVRRTYAREQLERLWVQHSGGLSYLIYPPEHEAPWGVI